MSNLPLASDRPLPEGVRDLLFTDAATLRGMAAALRTEWSRWGYRELVLPTFEYAGTLSTNVGAQIDAEMYRFFDRHGRTLALRPDMTIPTARVIGTRLFDQAMPLRICYVGSVFRYEPPRAGKQHEFMQAGVELIGAPGSMADAEAVALAVASLQAVGLPEFRLSIGHVGYFRGLLAALALSEQAASAVRQAVDRKAEAELAAILKSEGVNGDAADALLALPLLSGGEAVLDGACERCLNESMERALAELRAVADLLEPYGVRECVTYDLAEVRDLDYYTGLTFEGFAPGLGFSLISGGRYDDLIGHFGPPQPAVGWAMTLDRILEARELQRVAPSEPAPDLLVTGDGPHVLRWTVHARQRGLRVEVDPLALSGATLWQNASERDIARVLSLQADGSATLRDDAGERPFDLTSWEEVDRWLTLR